MCLLAGPIDRNRGCFFLSDSIFSPETVEIGSVLTIPVVLSSFSCHILALCLFLSPRSQILEHYMIFPAVPHSNSLGQLLKSFFYPPLRVVFATKNRFSCFIGNAHQLDLQFCNEAFSSRIEES